jgi:hypothetical protein
MLIEYPPQTIIGRPSAWIGPHHLEIDLAPELGNRAPATQQSNALPPQPSAMKNALLLRV